jgi:hypothetical protein
LCVAGGGSGGGICSNSSLLTSPRSISVCNFSDCVGGNENKGNDFSDINSVEAVASLYFIVNIQSTSNSVKFFFESLNYSMDCMLVEDGCTSKVGTVYVSASSGFNTFFCGDQARMCGSVDHATRHEWDDIYF